MGWHAPCLAHIRVMPSSSKSSSKSSPQLEKARQFVGQWVRNKWHIDKLLGVGGMASVYAATHRNGRRGAIKLLLPEISRNAEIRERFLREGYVANRIGHPGVVGILDDDETEEGLAFLVMELLRGASLQARLRQVGVLPPLEVLFVADQVLDVLVAAHQAQVIHRDIKPGNVFLLTDGRVKVLDFGLARVLDGPRYAKTRRHRARYDSVHGPRAGPGQTGRHRRPG